MSSKINTISGISSTAVNTNIAACASTTLTSIVSSYNQPFEYDGSGTGSALIVGNEPTVDLYIIEKWQSRKPIDIGDGLFISFKDDLLTPSEIKEIIYKKLEEQYPEKVIKIGLDKDAIDLRKYSIPIEINTKDN